VSFLAPGFLMVAGLVALVAVGLHFLSTRDPRLEPFPTARFVPDAPVRATATKVRLTDPWLLLLRVVLLLLAGAAVARPVVTPPRRPVARIVALDVSRAVGSPRDVADSARTYLQDAATVILFDSATREVPSGAADSLARGGRIAPSRGSLSAALVAARRAAAALRDRADSLELVVVSPFAAEERDAATAAIRSLWPGRVHTVPVAAASPPRDSVRVEWADSARNTTWTARASADTIGALRAGDAVLVYPFVRRWKLAGPLEPATRVYARWMDGEPVAVERWIGNRCIRSLGFALPAEGDALLRPEFQRFLEGLRAPCGAPRDFAPLPASVMTSFRGTGALAPAAALAPRVERVTPLMPWLLAAVLLLAILELIARRRSTARPRTAAAAATAAGPAPHGRAA
jgi:aerotolerance regulator-like protein